MLIGAPALGLLLLLPPAYWDRMDTIGAEADSRDFSAAGRLYFWGVAVDMANHNPIFGLGTVGFQAAYNEYDKSAGAYGKDRAVHSTWFGILADQGYLGLLMFVSILVTAFLACGRARKAALGVPGREQLFAYAGAMQTALVTAAVGGTFLSYHYVEILWHFAALSFALGAIADKLPEVESPVKAAALECHPAIQFAR
jgi:O-antigen ligase